MAGIRAQDPTLSRCRLTNWPREVWIDLVRKLGIAENVLVEVPLPTSPPEPWSGVWGVSLMRGMLSSKEEVPDGTVQ